MLEGLQLTPERRQYKQQHANRCKTQLPTAFVRAAASLPVQEFGCEGEPGCPGWAACRGLPESQGLAGSEPGSGHTLVSGPP